MIILAKTSAVLVAILHFFFMYLEMFLWNKPYGLKAFRLTQELADSTKVLAMNQGLYNGFLAAGILYALVRNDFSTLAFFLVCVFIAGFFGGATSAPKIFFIQSIPAFLAIILNYFWRT